MPNRRDSFLHSCVKMMGRPLAQFCVSRGIKFQDFVEISKSNFVSVAESKLRSEAREVSNSRVSIMTGLQRPEVKRLLGSDEAKESTDVITRIVGQWERDKRFVDSKRRPRPLEATSKSSDFAKLVKVVSKDLNPHTVKYEMERLGLIKVEGRYAHLLQREYIAKGNPGQTIRFGAEDARDLLYAVEENAFISSETPNLHVRTQYDNIPDAYLPKIKSAILELGRRFHAECRDLLGQFDRDINPSLSEKEGRNRVVVGTFSRVEGFPDEHREEGKK